MENNEKDFMKNRPVASGANQAKDVFGAMKRSNLNIITVVLAIVVAICGVACFLNGRIVSGVLFFVLLIILILSVFVAKSSDKANEKVGKHDHPDAIFKDHEY